MMLPNNWLWNMVDEFLYQFQSFAQHRAKLGNKSQEEIELLKKCDKVGWGWWGWGGGAGLLAHVLRESWGIA